MYFGEQNILKYMHLNAREFLETAAQNLQNYRPQGTGKPEKPILPELKTVCSMVLHPPRYSYLLTCTQKSCFNFTRHVQSTLPHMSKSSQSNLWQREAQEQNMREDKLLLLGKWRWLPKLCPCLVPLPPYALGCVLPP